jgi:hypothetical protein
VAPTPGSSAIPAELGRYKLIDRHGVEGAAGDSAYRFTDGSATHVTVFVYAIPRDVQVSPDSQSWTTLEGKKFQEVQPLLVERGMIGAYQLAFANNNDLTIGNRTVNEHATAIVIRSRGQVAVDFQYLYLVAGRFLKVRATVPQKGWEKTDVPTFARALARQFAAGTP